VSHRIERAVIGGDWGANGYTTMAQARLLAGELALRPVDLRGEPAQLPEQSPCQPGD
jgi:hypothetical protein